MLDLLTLLKAKYPSWVAWSPGGNRIAYALTGLSGIDLMIYSLPEKSSKLLVSDVPFPRIQGPYLEDLHLSWTKDGKGVVFNKRNTFYEVQVDSGESELLVSMDHLGQGLYPRLSPDLKELSFIKDEALWIKPVREDEVYQLTKGIPGIYFNTEALGGGWSPDSKKIAFTALGAERSSIGVVSLETREVSWIDARVTSQPDDYPIWSDDSRKLAFVRGTIDGRKTELRVASVSEGKVKCICADVDERMVGHTLYGASWSHRDDMLAFVSDKNGWGHLYVASIDDEKPQQLTRGSYEVFFVDLVTSVGADPAWSRDDSEIAFLSNKGSPHERHIFTVPPSGGETKKIVNMKGYCQGFHWSPSGKHIAFLWTGPSQAPSLWVTEASGEEKPTPVFDSLPGGLSKEDIANYEAVTYKSADGTVIPAVLIVPRNLNKDKKHPAVVFVYGGGMQLALLGPLPYPGAYFFDSYLAQKGYIILRVDPRGSRSYGKDFYTAVNYKNRGIDKQVQDLECAAKYLAFLGYVDPRRIGLCGHSNGGFLTAQTLVQAPEAFAAGFASGGVYMYEGLFEYYMKASHLALAWLLPRWGYPKENPELVRKWSPQTQIERLKSPIFIAHGEVDTNVPLSQAKGMVVALMMNGKEFDFMMYPGQSHGLDNLQFARDYMERFEKFFDKHLQFKKE